MPANPIDLTTLTAVNQYGVLANCTENNQVVQDLITSASAYWLRRTGLASLNSVNNYNEAYDGNGNSILYLDNRKILALSSLQVNGISIPQSTSVNTPGWYIDRQGKYIGIRGFNAPSQNYGTLVYGATSSGVFATFNRGPVGAAFPRGEQNIQVVYTAGYIEAVPNQPLVITDQTIDPNLFNDLNQWYSDQGVVYATGANAGTAFVNVAADPEQGQYTVSSTGVYGFNTADNNAQVLVSYTIQGPPADVYDKVTKQVCTEIKRLGYLDQATRAVDGGSIKYQAWDVSPDIEAVIQAYKRQSRS